MNFTCYGCRGSYPVARLENIKYGGNTTCYFIQENDTKIIIDGGTGIALLGRYLYGNYYPNPIKLNIFLTHGHWDHIMGLPQFQLFYFEQNAFTIFAPGDKESDVSKMIIKLHHVSNSSIPFEKLQADIKFKNLKSESKFELEDAYIKTYQINHPSMDLGYRITSKHTGRSISILTDIAPIENNYLPWGWKEKAAGREKKFEQEYYQGLINFIRKTDLLIIDSHFTEEDIKGKEHWGHSTPELAMKIAVDGGVDNLMLTHHNPEYSDTKTDYIFEQSQKKAESLGIKNLLIAMERDSHVV